MCPNSSGKHTHVELNLTTGLSARIKHTPLRFRRNSLSTELQGKHNLYVFRVAMGFAALHSMLYENKCALISSSNHAHLKFKPGNS